MFSIYPPRAPSLNQPQPLAPTAAKPTPTFNHAVGHLTPLENDIYENIGHFLPTRDILNLRLTSKAFKECTRCLPLTLKLQDLHPKTWQDHWWAFKQKLVPKKEPSRKLKQLKALCTFLNDHQHIAKIVLLHSRDLEILLKKILAKNNQPLPCRTVHLQEIFLPKSSAPLTAKQLRLLQNFLNKLTHLQELTLTAVPLKDPQLAEMVKQLPALKALKLKECPEIKFLTALVYLPQLEFLSLQDSSIFNRAIFNISNYTPHLKSLSLEQTPKITYLKDLPKLTNLETLNLQSSNIMEDAFPNTFQTVLNVKILNLAGCIYIQSLYFLKSFSWLEYLNLSHTSIEESELLYLSNFCTRLKILILENCSGMIFLDYLQNVVYLEELSLGHTPITNKALKNLAKNCPFLKKLYLHHCLNFTTLIGLYNLRSLQKLYLRHTHLAAIELTKLQEQLPELEIIT